MLVPICSLMSILRFQKWSSPLEAYNKQWDCLVSKVYGHDMNDNGSFLEKAEILTFSDMSTIMLNPIQPQAQTATGIYSPGMTSTRQ
jgi:hypothetical protein